MRRNVLPIVVLLTGLAAAAGLARWIDDRRHDDPNRFAEEQLYLSGPAAKRMSLAFNGLVADWYWMRSLQYVGRKVVSYEDAHNGQFQLGNLSSLDLRLLANLLDVTTTLDPQFIPAYEYGAVILPEINSNQAIALLDKGIAANPSSWRLHQHLGYIFWQRQDYAHAGATYAAGSKLAGAPAWMAAMAARMKADAGSRDAAREMYRRLYEVSEDASVREMVQHHLLRLDWLDQRDIIRRVLQYDEVFRRSAPCPSSWREIADQLRRAGIAIDATGSPIDPTGVPYYLNQDRCDVELDPSSTVPR